MEEQHTPHRPPTSSPAAPARPGSRGIGADTVGRWLAAEAADDPRAEDHLAALFTALPWLDPPAGFAGRVLERVAPRPAHLPAPVRWLTAAALLLGSLAWVLGGQLARTGLEALPNPVVALFDLAGLATQGLVFVASLLTQVPDWLRLARLAAATPPVVLTGCLTVLVAAALLRLLQQTVDRERTWSHA
jgi:hypothetical protein